MNEFHLALVVVGGLVLALGVFSNPIKNKLPLSPPLLALLLGIVLGTAGLNVLNPARWGSLTTILEEAARITLAIGLMALALRLPPRHFIDQFRPMAVLLGLLMPLMWVSTSLIAYAVLGLAPVMALLIGAILTPTDPIVASSIVTATLAKESLPGRIRNNLLGEAGANDGLAYLFVLLPILFITNESSAPLRHWFLSTLLGEVGGAILIGGLTGVGAGWLLAWGERRSLIVEPSFLAYTVALSLVTLGVAKVLGTDGILAVFVCGVIFGNMVGGTERANEANVQEAVNQFFTLPIFTLIGLAIPVDQWVALGWRGLLLAVAVLALRRLPAVLAVRPWMRPLDRMPDALFVGWFGPIGVSALLYAMLAIHRVGDESIWVYTSLIICTSIVAHGVTATPLTRLYARKTASELAR